MVSEWNYELAATLEESTSRFVEAFRNHGFGLFCQLDSSQSTLRTLILRLVYPRSAGVELLCRNRRFRSRAFTAVLQEVGYQRVAVSLRAPAGLNGKLLAEALSSTIEEAFSGLSSSVAAA